MKYILALLIAGNMFAYNMSDLVSDIRIAIRDNSTDTNNQHYSTPDLYRIIELGQNYIIRKSAGLETTSYTTPTANVSTYTLATDCLEIRRVEVSTSATGTYYPLVYTSKKKLDSVNIDWKNEVGKPKYWYKVRYSDPVIGIYPNIQSTYVIANGIRYDYIQKSESYSTYASTTTLFRGKVELESYYNLLIYYVADALGYPGNLEKLNSGIAMMIMELNINSGNRNIQKEQ